ncbi:hypothetical protein ACIGB8_22315 [Promicromonospora sukumoe]|uniref:hypothetical protein n=1 Tax=Promicromonospora sukumoe TaxID=88382 RepID=UPI0037C80AEA
MNTIYRRVLLLATVAVGAYAGVWAAFFPESFYVSFPGFGLHWIDVDGAYNEHLIRDVGSLYLGLGAGSLAAALSRSALPGRVLGLVWAVFGVLHLVYHLGHLHGSVLDVVGNVVSLGGSALLGVLLMLPVRGEPAATEPPGTTGA